MIKYLERYEVDDKTSSIEVLNLNHNEIREIGQDFFRSMPQLRRLYLSHNKINSTIEPNTFKKNTELTVIDLSNNDIEMIKSETFFHFRKLVFISLSNNRLLQIPEKLPSLQWFDISDNLIESVLEIQQNDIFPHEVLLLGGNPFRCDCHIQWLKEFFDTRKYLLKYVDVAARKFIPVCAHPKKLSGQDWNHLSADAFTCDAEFTDKSLTSEHSSNKRDLNLISSVVNSNYIKLQWSVIDIEEDGEIPVYELSYHPFGKKNQQVVRKIENGVGKHTLKDLQENTAYIICLTLVVTDDNLKSKECIEVFTNNSHRNLGIGKSIISESFYYYLFWSCIFIIVVSLLSYKFEITFHDWFIRQLFKKMKEGNVQNKKLN